jgi:hypothetical protein
VSSTKEEGLFGPQNSAHEVHVCGPANWCSQKENFDQKNLRCSGEEKIRPQNRETTRSRFEQNAARRFETKGSSR